MEALVLGRSDQHPSLPPRDGDAMREASDVSGEGSDVITGAGTSAHLAESIAPRREPAAYSNWDGLRISEPSLSSSRRGPEGPVHSRGESEKGLPLEKKLELLTAQRRCSTRQCRLFVEELEAFMSKLSTKPPPTPEASPSPLPRRHSSRRNSSRSPSPFHEVSMRSNPSQRQSPAECSPDNTSPSHAAVQRRMSQPSSRRRRYGPPHSAPFIVGDAAAVMGVGPVRGHGYYSSSGLDDFVGPQAQRSQTARRPPRCRTRSRSSGAIPSLGPPPKYQDPKALAASLRTSWSSPIQLTQAPHADRSEHCPPASADRPPKAEAGGVGGEKRAKHRSLPSIDEDSGMAADAASLRATQSAGGQGVRSPLLPPGRMQPARSPRTYSERHSGDAPSADGRYSNRGEDKYERSSSSPVSSRAHSTPQWPVHLISIAPTQTQTPAQKLQQPEVEQYTPQDSARAYRQIEARHADVAHSVTSSDLHELGRQPAFGSQLFRDANMESSPQGGIGLQDHLSYSRLPTDGLNAGSGLPSAGVNHAIVHANALNHFQSATHSRRACFHFEDGSSTGRSTSESEHGFD